MALKPKIYAFQTSPKPVEIPAATRLLVPVGSQHLVNILGLAIQTFCRPRAIGGAARTGIRHLDILFNQPRHILAGAALFLDGIGNLEHPAHRALAAITRLARSHGQRHWHLPPFSCTPATVRKYPASRARAAV
jgi:hypothetical protein